MDLPIENGDFPSIHGFHGFTHVVYCAFKNGFLKVVFTGHQSVNAGLMAI